MPELPLEVWSNITVDLQLQPMRLGDYAPDSAFLARRACLRNLCLTSHKLLAAAQPLLYESIILYHIPEYPSAGPKSLVQLLRSLATSPSLRPHIRHLACALNLWPARCEIKKPRDAVVHEWQAMRDAFEDLPTVEKRFFDKASLFELPAQVQAPVEAPQTRIFRVIDDTQLSNNDSQVPQKLLAILLCFVPKLQTVLLQGSSHADSPARPFSDLLQHFLVQGGVDQSPVLPRLSTIRLQPDRGASPETWTGVQICQDALAHLPSLRRLDIWKASYTANNAANNITPQPKWANRLENIRIAMGSTMGEIVGLVEQAHALKNLRVDYVTLPARLRLHATPQTDLNQALQQHAATLVRLRLTGITAPLQWQGLRLSCLPQLRCVEELEIEHQQLAGPGVASEEVRVPDLLPPNLRRLKLFFLLGCEKNFQTFMLTFPLDLQFARLQGRLKSLQEIHLEVFSDNTATKDKKRLLAALDDRLVAMLGQGCNCTYNLNRNGRDAENVEPWALDEF